MGVTFSGLASGLDTTSLINGLVGVERGQATPLQTKQSDLNTQESIVNSLSARLASLGSLASGMNLKSEVSPRTASVSDSHIQVAASSSAAAATHDIRVLQLARAAVTSSRTFATADAGVLGNGSLTLTKAGTPVTVSWTATDSLSDIASKINDANGGASASVLYDGSTYRLVMTANDTGTAAAPTFTDAGDGLALSDPANVKVAARDAKITIDTMEVTRGKNLIDDALSGVTITAVSEQATGDPDTHLTVANDRDGLTKQVQAIVDAYNAVNGALHVQLDYTGTAKGTDTLFGDSTLRSLQGSLGAIMSASYGGSGDGSDGMTLGQLGISRDKTGAMTLDTSKLSDALAANPDAVSNLFVGGGFAKAMTDLSDMYTQVGTGLFSAKLDSMTAQTKSLQDQIDRINTNADSLQAQLTAQFSALEQAMSQMQSQSAYLTRVLG